MLFFYCITLRDVIFLRKSVLSPKDVLKHPILFPYITLNFWYIFWKNKLHSLFLLLIKRNPNGTSRVLYQRLLYYNMQWYVGSKVDIANGFDYVTIWNGWHGTRVFCLWMIPSWSGISQLIYRLCVVVKNHRNDSQTILIETHGDVTHHIRLGLRNCLMSTISHKHITKTVCSR
jgi:hypothetical protein